MRFSTRDGTHAAAQKSNALTPNLLFPGTYHDYRAPFVPQVGLTYVRGCEVEGMLDEQGKVIEEGPDPKPKIKGDTRTYR